MKKITFILLALIATQVQAQFSGAGFYRIRAAVDDNGTANYFSVSDLVAIEPNEENPMPQQPARMAPLNGTSSEGVEITDERQQIFEFVSLNDTFDGGADGTDLEVFNIVSTVPGKGFVELQALDTDSSRLVFRNRSNEEAGVLGLWYVGGERVDDGAFRIANAHNDVTSGNRLYFFNSGFNFVNQARFRSNAASFWIFEPVDEPEQPTFSTSDLKASDFFVSNPVQNELNVRGLNSNTIESITIYDIIGKEVLNTSVNASQATLNISSLISGLYIVKLSNSTGSFTTKIIKQ